MIEYTIQSGIDYGVDPKLILSVIQQEVGFKGLSSNVTGKNGKGYMQLTSAPINDYLGLSSDRQYHEIKDFLYLRIQNEILIFPPADFYKDMKMSKQELLLRQEHSLLTNPVPNPEFPPF